MTGYLKTTTSNIIAQKARDSISNNTSNTRSKHKTFVCNKSHTTNPFGLMSSTSYIHICRSNTYHITHKWWLPTELTCLENSSKQPRMTHQNSCVNFAWHQPLLTALTSLSYLITNGGTLRWADITVDATQLAETNDSARNWNTISSHNIHLTQFPLNTNLKSPYMHSKTVSVKYGSQITLVISARKEMKHSYKTKNIKTCKNFIENKKV